MCEPHLAEGGSKVQGICVAAPRSHSLEELRCKLCLPGSEPTLPPLPSGLWSQGVLLRHQMGFPDGVVQTYTCLCSMLTGLGT